MIEKDGKNIWEIHKCNNNKNSFKLSRLVNSIIKDGDDWRLVRTGYTVCDINYCPNCGIKLEKTTLIEAMKILNKNNIGEGI